MSTLGRREITALAKLIPFVPVLQNHSIMLLPNQSLFDVGVICEVKSCEPLKEYIANLWEKLFPGKIPGEFVLPEAIQGDELELEGHKLIAEDIGFSDTDNTTYLYVPSIGLVVAGDIVYNGIHPYLIETTRETRLEWIAALDKIEALNPRFVVAGHKIPENKDSPLDIKATRD